MANPSFNNVYMLDEAKLQYRFLCLLIWFNVTKHQTGMVSVEWKRLHNLLKW